MGTVGFSDASCHHSFLVGCIRVSGELSVQTLESLGWQSFFEQQVAPNEMLDNLIARVVAHHGSQILFDSPQGELVAPTSIIEPGQSSYSQIAVGDWFVLEPKTLRSVRCLDRKTLIARKSAGEEVKPQLIAANVDTVFIVSSCNQEFNLSRIERYLSVTLDAGCTPVVVLTKADLCEDPAAFRCQVERLHQGVYVETLDARDPVQASVLTGFCATGKTIAVLGSSGVGKSTLTNAMGGCQILTGEIREADSKGRHTTTARSMHRLAAGGWLIDNPGMREFQLAACEDGISELFEDVVQIAASCRFRNCEHNGEPGCAIRAAIEDGQLDRRRYLNFEKMQAEQRRNSQSLAQRRESERKQGAFYKQVISGKQKIREIN